MTDTSNNNQGKGKTPWQATKARNLDNKPRQETETSTNNQKPKQNKQCYEQP